MYYLIFELHSLLCLFGNVIHAMSLCWCLWLLFVYCTVWAIWEQWCWGGGGGALSVCSASLVLVPLVHSKYLFVAPPPL